jgi:WhiB family redox-sensing transcriptional regulator
MTITTMTKPTWRKYARCLGADSELFYPASDAEDAAEPAKAICAVCPVREPCLDHAITAREK